MTTRVHTFANVGLEGFQVLIEADANKALPTLDIIGLPDAAVKEAKERIRMAFKNCEVQLPPRKIVVNLAPSDLKKEGTRYDLAMAAAILSLIHPPTTSGEDLLSTSLFFGELGLDGSVKKVTGLLPCVLSAYKQGWRKFVVPAENMNELQYIPHIELISLTNFLQIVNFFVKDTDLPIVCTGSTLPTLPVSSQQRTIDFADIRGHTGPKRALTIAAAGMHNTLLIGPPGSGKTMLSKAMHGVLPPLSFSEILEVSQLYSLVGKLTPEQPLITARPCRVVHHTASKVSIVGGGRHLTPGEISLAHLGLLFFDELAEFPREVLEVLRQPLEDRVVTISRAQGSVAYPAGFMFVATMNPCKCGYYKDQQKPCICSLNEVKRYQSRISGPLLDRFDMVLEVPREPIDMILDKQTGDSSQDITSCVRSSRERQQKRYKDIHYSTNAQLDVKSIHQLLRLDVETETFLKNAIKQLHLSPRVMHRIIKVARTIADVGNIDEIQTSHIAEALQYRTKTMLVNA